MGKECRVWVVFANERKCNHTRCLLTKGFVSWILMDLKLEMSFICLCQIAEIYVLKQ